MKRNSPFIVSLLLILVLLVSTFSVMAEEKEELNFNLDLGLDWKEKENIKPEFAEHFKIVHYENGCKLIALSSGESYLYVPEEQEIPEELPEEIVPIQGNVENIFLAHTGAMSFFDELESLDALRFSGLPDDEWFIPNAQKAMQDSKILYAGKYREPDFELLSAEKCQFCIFNTGIRKHDKVLSMLKNLKINYFIDISSEENHPLARLEWIKVYAALLNKEKEAEIIFRKQIDDVKKIEDGEATDLTVAIFSINKDGDVLTRKSDDYLVKIIESAGAKFVIEDTTPYETKSSVVKLGMEDFYVLTKNADTIIYNGMTDGHPESLDEVLSLNPLLEDFKAIKENQCYSIGKNFFQESSKMAEIISEFRFVFTENKAKADGEFIQKLDHE